VHYAKPTLKLSLFRTFARFSRDPTATHSRATCELENALGGAVRKFYSSARIPSIELAVYWVVGHRSSKRKRNSPLPKLSKLGQQDRKAEESRNRKVKAEAEAAEDPATGFQSGDREEETH
jgi:hypothetical protein